MLDFAARLSTTTSRAVGSAVVQLGAVLGLGLALALVPVSSAHAQQAADDTARFPTQPVRVVVVVSAGSQADMLARSYADELAKRWRVAVTVENRPGLAGVASVAKAAPDGATLLLASNGHAMIRSLNRNINFDPITDFATIAQVASTPGILVVPANGPSTLAELIATAKAAPGSLNYASAGLGSAASIGIELLSAAADIKLVHLPLKGLPDMHTSVIRGDVALTLTFYGAGGDLIEAGKIHPLAVTTATRTSVLPNVPTVEQAGVAGYVYDPWFGMLAPAGTPRTIVERVSADLAAIATDGAFKQRFARLGIDVATTGPAAFESTLRTDTERFFAIFGHPQPAPAR